MLTPGSNYLRQSINLKTSNLYMVKLLIKTLYVFLMKYVIIVFEFASNLGQVNNFTAGNVDIVLNVIFTILDSFEKAMKLLGER